MVKLFIGNLPREATEQEIRSLFEQYGKVLECDIIKNYGFVHIEDKTAAEDAIRNLHHYKLHGVNINVEASKNKSKASTKLHANAGDVKRCRFDPWLGRVPWRRAWQPTPVFLPGECPWTEEPGGLLSMHQSGSSPICLFPHCRRTGRLKFPCRTPFVAQLVKNLPAMRETWVPSLGWEDPLEKRKATHSSILAW